MFIASVKLMVATKLRSRVVFRCNDDDVLDEEKFSAILMVQKRLLRSLMRFPKRHDHLVPVVRPKALGVPSKRPDSSYLTT